jgi:hypothetical protein
LKRLARCALAALLAAAFASPVYAAPPPVLAPVVSVVAVAAPMRASAIALPAAAALHEQAAPSAPAAVGMDLPPTVAAARAYALEQLGPVGFDCLDRIVMHESKWNPLASNSGGAYGIPQAWPADKMASAGADWRWNPVTQVKWMLWYVKAKYVTACNAAAYRDRNGIY